MSESLESIRHARSNKDFPFLNLEEGEYVELVIGRSKISIIIVWFLVVVALLLITLSSLTFPILFPEGSFITLTGNTKDIFSFILVVLFALTIIIGLIITKVHFGNKLYVTNTRAIHVSTLGLFNNSTNVIELSRIEDVSFKQEGLIQKIFGYGTIRMSTVGDETTYTFPFVDTPTDEVQTISHLVHIIRNKKYPENNP